MKDKFPCLWNEDAFPWWCNVILEDWNPNSIVIASPVNPICNSCEYFKTCLNAAIEWMKTEELQENNSVKDKSKLH